MAARDLWQFITDSSLTKPKQLVSEEISKHADQLKCGLQYYKDPRVPAGELLKQEKKLDNVTVVFIKKLSQFLGLDEIQSYDLYHLYVSREYRGTASHLKSTLTVDRHTQTLLSKLRDHYSNERLYLLRSIKHMLAHWKDEQHPFQVQYKAFVQPLYKADDFTKSILKQYDTICEDLAPTWETHGKYMNDRNKHIWIVQNLREQFELLEILLLYYTGVKMSLSAFLDLANKFKRQGFGWRQTNRQLLAENVEPLLKRISFLQVILLIEGLSLKDLKTKFKAQSAGNHHIVMDKTFELVNQYFESMGQSPEHGPLLLAWTAVRELSDYGDEMKTASMGNKALHVKVFPYIVSKLKMDPFRGKSTTARLSHSIIYDLMCTVLEAFHYDTLQDKEGLQDIAATLLKQNHLLDDFWKSGMESGLGPLFQLARSNFPLELNLLVDLCVSLAQAGPHSAEKVIRLLQNMDRYTEVMSTASDVKITEQQNIWELTKNKRPYQASGGDVLIPCDTLGDFYQLGNASIIAWNSTYNAWEVFVGELNQILQQITHGQGMVQAGNVQRVTSICRLVNVLLMTSNNLLTLVPQLEQLTPLIYQVISRFSLVHPPPLELLSACVQCVHQFALQDPIMTWRRLQQTNLLPSLTENLENLAALSRGSGLTAGIYGSILAGTECTHGQYPLTTALLDLISALIMPLSESDEVDMLLACVMYVTREIFPVFSKWRYYDITRREAIGQKCLKIFHSVLNILDVERQDNNKVSVRSVCVYSLLYTEAGQALLDIVATTVDSVNFAIASQGNVTEGAGIELIQMIRMAFSVLNHLLLLRPKGATQSPVEQSLSVQGSRLSGKKNPMATIAQYIYHRHDPSLVTLAIVLLRRLAMMFPMSILACLGDEAEPIRDVFLSRLQDEAEDVHLKVVILEFLSTCVDTQPGLIETFINVKTLAKKSSTDTGKDKANAKYADQNVAVSQVSCLQTVLSLIEGKKQGTYECPSHLLSAAIEFIHALWDGQRETAMEALRKKPGFWHSVCMSLTRNLQAPTDEDYLQKEVHCCANIMKILALELYHSQGSDLDDNLKIVLDDILSQGRLLYWSQYLCESMRWSSVQGVQARQDNPSLHLLYAWRNLQLVLSCVRIKGKNVNVPDAAKEKILLDILTGVEHQFSSPKDMTKLNIKLGSVASAFYITLLKRWLSYLDSWTSMIQKIEKILEWTKDCYVIIPSMQIGLLGALSLILQHVRHDYTTSIDENDLAPLVPILCNLIQKSTYQLPSPTQQAPRQPPPSPQSHQNNSLQMSMLGNTTVSSTLTDQNHSNRSMLHSEMNLQSDMSSPLPETSSKLHKAVQVQLKLQTTSLCLLEELVTSLSHPQYWLPDIKHYAVLQALLASIEGWVNVHQGVEYVHTVFMLLLRLAKHSESAERIASRNFIQQLCLLISQLYNQPEETSMHGSMKPKTLSKTPCIQLPSWSSIYCLGISLYTSLLVTLKYKFLKHGLEFIGVHQDRMHKCLSSAGVLLQHDVLEEAIQTCHYVSELSVYRREWRLQLPHVLQKLMTDVCMLLQCCVSSLIRPQLLQHMLKVRKSGHNIVQVLAQDKYISAPLIRSMSQQHEDYDHPSHEVMVIQNRLLMIVCQCLISLRKFSPHLCEIIMEQTFDVSEYESFLQIGFSTPSVEQDKTPTFGTLISCINLCLFLLNKVDPRGPSGTPPAKQDTDKSPIERNLIMLVLENTLYLIMSQTLRCLKDPTLHSRDKQLIKRELSSELNSFLSGMQRYLRRGTGSHTPANQTPVLHMLAENNYLKLVTIFVSKVLR